MKKTIAVLVGLGILILGSACGAESEPQDDGSSDPGYAESYESQESESNPLTYYEVETPQGIVGCIVYTGSTLTCDW